MGKVYLLSILLLFSCAKDKLQPLTTYYRSYEVNANIDFCTIDPEMSKSFLKFIFVIDKSSSNQFAPGTDPTGERRYDPIINFLNDTPDDPTVSYTLVNFSNDATRVTNEFVNRAAFSTVIKNEKNLTNPLPPILSSDSGWTDYIDAIDLVYEIIQTDINDASHSLSEVISSHYVIIFLSDGFPQDENGNDQDPASIRNKAQQIALMSTQEEYKDWAETVQFHTGYYYGTETNPNGDDSARNLLSDVATQGNGDFYEFPSGSSLEYGKFAVPERNVKHALKDIFVLNVNTLWDEDQRVLDSDGDGLSDAIEDQFGSNKFNTDSDNNGVSDGVEYNITKKPCADRDCNPANAEPYTSCTRFIRPGWQAGQPDKYIDQDKDLLNNCEEVAVLESNHFNYDSNDDWIPDDVAFRFGGISYLSDTSEPGALLDPDADGIDNYQELKINTPWNFDNSKVIDLKQYGYKMNLTQDYYNKTCYHVEVNNIIALRPENRLRVYILEKNAIIDDKRYMRIAEKEVILGGTVNFTPDDFL